MEEFGEDEYLEEKKLMDEVNEKEVEPVFEGPLVPNKVLKILPYDDKFYLTLDGCDAGFIYECSFFDPLQGKIANFATPSVFILLDHILISTDVPNFEKNMYLRVCYNFFCE